jgi:hypothetical protein
MAEQKLTTPRPPQQPASYPDAAIRGRLRQWKERLAEWHWLVRRPVATLAEDAALGRLVAGFGRRGTVKGRARALKQIARRLGPGAVLEEQRLAGAAPYALWRVLNPRPSIFADPDPQSSQAQDCVTVDYVVLDRSGVSTSVWSLAVPDHALGRALQRHGPGVDPDALVAAAHANLLRLRVDTVVPHGAFDETLSFLVRAGEGGFVCRLLPGCEEGGRTVVYAYASTWLNEDQLRDEQILLAPDGAPGERLGDHWLKPLPLRTAAVRSPGLPTALDLRRVWQPGEIADLIETIAAAEVVWADHGDDQGGSWVKGQELVQAIAAGADPQEVRMLCLTVVNTTQIELLLAALAIHEREELHGAALDEAARMLSLAATVPGGRHDDTLFQAALERSQGGAAGSA